MSSRDLRTLGAGAREERSETLRAFRKLVPRGLGYSLRLDSKDEITMVWRATLKRARIFGDRRWEPRAAWAGPSRLLPSFWSAVGPGGRREQGRHDRRPDRAASERRSCRRDLQP